MSNELTLEAQSRSDVGKGASRRLRREGARVPAIIYGAGKDAQQISVELRHIVKALENEGFYNQIIDLVVDGKAEDVILRALQRHPSKGVPMHADFMRVDATQALTLTIGITLVNEEECEGVRLENGLLTRNLTDIEISCLPKNIPETLELDVANLKVGESLHLSDIALPEGVEIPVLQHGEEYDQPVVSVIEQREEEPEEDVAAEEEATESAEEESSDEE